MNRWTGKAAVATAVAALALSACGSGAGTGGTGGGPSAARLTVALRGTPQSLAANVPVSGGQTLFYQPLYDSLLQLKADGTPAPMLATAWSYDAAQTVLTLTLRTGVKFSNGEPFDAAAAKANLDRAVKSGINAATLGAVTDIAAPDTRTLVLTLAQRDPGLVSALGTSVAYMQAPGTFERPDAATAPVGTGPYILAPKTVIGSVYVYTRNPEYWDTAAAKYGEIDLKVMSDPSAMLNAVKSGQVNAAQISSAQNAQVQQAGWKVTSQELNTAGLFLFDRDGKLSPPLKNPLVRQAVNLAIDRAAMLRTMAAGQGTVSTQILGPIDPALDAKWAYDPAKAKQLIAQAGYASGDVAFTMPIFPGAGQLMDAIKAQLAAVGITVDLVQAGPNALSELLAGKYPVSYFQFQTGDPWVTMQQLLTPTSQFNPFHTDDPKIGELVRQYRDGDAAQQRTALLQLDQYVTDQAWFAPWYLEQTPWATDANTTVQLVKGWASPNVLGFAPKS
ncbi:ABC transporter substrate-binding protein [Kitasatospora sp. NPDC094019]|uniref:ABC transporter substrate-binding protein n=1 Tax=Kitasatospora sp. NPDC094019 TaxID=3364091 RepID=UPI00381217D3